MTQRKIYRCIVADVVQKGKFFMGWGYTLQCAQTLFLAIAGVLYWSMYFAEQHVWWGSMCSLLEKYQFVRDWWLSMLHA